ncbi:MAG: putative metalloprotease CJM1_0395 family protein [Colwellia sp.]|nr:putative metalloprotease CJM1_0395 family protein [Colwellia sp.]
MPTVLNPHTETLRRENSQREIISQPAALTQSAAEKGVASDKERGRTPAQNNENIDFASLKEKAELANNVVSEQNKEQDKGGDQQASQEEEQESNQNADTVSNQEPENRTEEFQQAREINELQRRDQEVRSHELAHASVGGAFTGSPNYSFETGPDGKKYAVEGEVSVDLSSVPGDPRATIAKMQKVHAAALAPANPSVQDTRIAASAAQIILQAQSELLAAQGNEFARVKAEGSAYVNPNSTLSQEREAVGLDDEISHERDFDTLINQTLKAQEYVAPSRSEEVIQRAGRIESFYSNISQAYEKPASYQFELTA